MKNFLLSIISFFLISNFAYAGAVVPNDSKASPPPVTPKAVCVKTSEYQIDAIDPNETNNPSAKGYPGFRGNNQLVIYTPVYGGKTGTNEFGIEAIIVNNKVVKICGMDNYIPQNGFVISGHGKAKEWIKANLFVGANAEIDFKNNKIKAFSTPESFSFQAEQKIQQVQDIIKSSKKTDMDIEVVNLYLDRAKGLLDVSKELLRLENYTEALKYADIASMYADMAFYNAIPYKKNEFKGIWIRPTEKNDVEISRTLDEIKSTGIDNIFLETYYQGNAIYPSTVLAKYGVKSQKDEFKNFDPLKSWVELAHKRNMKLHVWFQTFYAGSDELNENHILTKKPEWANVQKRNIDKKIPCCSGSEHNGYFLDPANPDVQAYLYKILNEIVCKYNIDGINIDYIRYPASLAPNFSNYLDSTWGYSNYARNEFKSIHNVDPATLTTKDPLWVEWNRYKELKINDFVYKLKNIKNLKKNILISTVIFPNETESSVLKSQNWKVWPQFGSVDAFTPLIMTSDAGFTKESLREIKMFTNNKVKVYPGLFEMFTGEKPVDLLYQILITRQAGADGVVIFDYAHMDKDFTNALKARVFKNTDNNKP